MLACQYFTLFWLQRNAAELVGRLIMIHMCGVDFLQRKTFSCANEIAIGDFTHRLGLRSPTWLIARESRQKHFDATFPTHSLISASLFRLLRAISLPRSGDQGGRESYRCLPNPTRAWQGKLRHSFPVQREVNWTGACSQDRHIQKEERKVHDGDGNWHPLESEPLGNYPSLRCFRLRQQTLLLHGVVRAIRSTYPLTRHPTWSLSV